MRTCLFASLLLFAAILVLTACGDSSPTSSLGVSGPDLIDPRDGQTYKTVTIGSQTWMAENLNYETEYSYCYNDDAENCKQYGRLYTWTVATSACPEGWHLPSVTEWKYLFNAVGYLLPVGKTLKSSDGWSNDGGGSNVSGFSALPAGAGKLLGEYSGENDSASFWSSSETGNNTAFGMYLGYDYDDAQLGNNGKHSKYSVRCLKGEAIEPTQVPSQFVKYDVMTDFRDGQTYKTVAIGWLTWMAENLNYKVDSSFCYNNMESNCATYGRLYTWDAATSVCPIGWHLPSPVDWQALISAVGMGGIALNMGGIALKSTSGWNSNGGGTDAFGFSALPAGWRDKEEFVNRGYSTYFWSSGEYDKDNDRAYVMYLRYDTASAKVGYGIKARGYSVRCVFGDPLGSMTDSRDGQTYKTVKIGMQTWMAQNLNYETLGSGCYKDSESQCAKYGRRYTWAAAMDSSGTWGVNGQDCGYSKLCSPVYPVRGVCPEGWHLPSDAEWMTLLDAVGGAISAGDALRSSYGWFLASQNSTDPFRFSVLPDGDDGFQTAFWGSAEGGNNVAFAIGILYNNPSASVYYNYPKEWGIQVRCIQD